ncbi:MAG: methyltransferase domain-containing protein [Candidatus Heimdallarchaeota archaeon]|nr:methyltransferase domain-containing protein [Candidatus Heimdallarchaeota archaeon]
MSSTEDWYFGYCFLDDPDEELTEFLERVEEGKALDIACGSGRNSFYLESLGYDVIGIDMSNIAIDLINEKAKQKKSKVRGVVSDIHDYQFQEKFDIIVLSYILNYFLRSVEQLGTLDKIINHIKIGGMIYVKVPYSDEYIGSVSLKEGMLRSTLNESNWEWEIIYDEVKYKAEDKNYGTYSFLAKKL